MMIAKVIASGVASLALWVTAPAANAPTLDAQTVPVVHMEQVPAVHVAESDAVDVTWPGASADETLHCYRVGQYPNAGWLDEFPDAVVIVADADGVLLIDDVPGEQEGQTAYATCHDALA